MIGVKKKGVSVCRQVPGTRAQGGKALLVTFLLAFSQNKICMGRGQGGGEGQGQGGKRKGWEEGTS